MVPLAGRAPNVAEVLITARYSSGAGLAGAKETEKLLVVTFVKDKEPGCAVGVVGQRQLTVRAAQRLAALAAKYISGRTAPVQVQDGLLAVFEHLP